MQKKWNLLFFIFEDKEDVTQTFRRFDWLNIAALSKTRARVTVWYHNIPLKEHKIIKIRNGSVTVHDISTVQSSVELLSELKTGVETEYRPRRRNIVLIGSHCFRQYVCSNKCSVSMESWAQYCEKQHIYLDCVVMDCCYAATLTIMRYLKNVTHYIVACQSASPWLGFNTQDLAKIFGSTRLGTRQTCVNLVQSFIARNNNAPKTLKFPTDGVVLDVKKLSPLLDSLTVMKRPKNAMVEPQWEKQIYDLKTVLTYHKNEDAFHALQKIIVFYKQSNLLKKKAHACRLHGLSVY